MKKVIFAALFLMMAMASKAQISYDVRVGSNVSGIENSDAKMKLGLKVGAGIDYAFSDALSLRPMLYYSSKGVSEGKNNLGFFPDKTMALNYLQIPVLVSYHIPVADNFSIVPSAGPYAAFLVSSTHNENVKYKTFDAGINAGLDFVVNRIIIGVEAEYGFTSISSNVDKLHNINYSLMVGYRF